MKRVITSNNAWHSASCFLLFAFIFLLLIFLGSCSNPKLENPLDPSCYLPAPSSLHVVLTSLNSCLITWHDNASNEEGYQIARKKDNEAWQFCYTVLDKDVTEFSDTGLSYDSSYSYRVQCYTALKTSDAVETELDVSIPVPENLQLTENTQGPSLSILLEWAYSADWIDGFLVYKNEVLVSDTISADERQWTDNGFCFGDLRYSVMACCDNYTSHASTSVECSNGIPGMVFVAGGTFIMGDHFSEGEAQELPLHQVTLNDFFIGEHEVSQSEYQAVMGSNPSWFINSSFPVERVAWYSAVTFCNEKSISEGLTPCYNLTDWSCDFSIDGYRLPTEAEWEYAARGGVHWQDNFRFSGSSTISLVAWYSGNSSYQTHAVVSKQANQLGIYNMSGNVWEWCNDWYSGSYYATSPSQNPQGPATGSNRVIRGGAYNSSDGTYCRVSHRASCSPPDAVSRNYLGFRIARGALPASR